jgi:phytoene dehydrogenase-like protein
VGAELEVVDAEGRATGEREQVRARHVVANLDPRRAAEMIGLERFSPAVRRRLDYTYSASNFMAYCAVEGLDLREHGFGRNNLFHADDPDLDGAFDDMVQRGDYRRVSFAMTTPSLISADQTGCPAGCQLVELLTVADYDRWQVLKNSGAKVYNEKKREVFDRMVDVIERDYVPGFRDHLVFKLLGSPTTNQRYVLSPAGNSYGADLIPSQMGPRRLTHESSIPGLSFCNASAGYPGFTGTIWTGATLWEAVSGDPVLTGPHVVEIA